MIKNLIAKYPYWFVTLWAVMLFIPFLGNVHLFDWDEINFAENAREMLLTGNYQQVQINFQPFWEKPPLFFWMQVLAMKAFNVFDPNSGFAPEFGARFPNAIIGIITLLVFYSYTAKKTLVLTKSSQVLPCCPMFTEWQHGNKPCKSRTYLEIVATFTATEWQHGNNPVKPSLTW